MFHFHVCCNLYLTTYSTCRFHLLPHFFPFHSCIPGLAASKIHYELPANARKRKNGQANPLQCYCIVRFGNAIRPRYWTRRSNITLHVMKLILTDETCSVELWSLHLLSCSEVRCIRVPVHALLSHKVPEQQLEGPLAEVTIVARNRLANHSFVVRCKEASPRLG
jgi:hypothetical protein